MIINAFFNSQGVPATGLSAKIDVWKTDGTHVINNQGMTEIAGGFYFYDFTDYDEDLDYVIRADGSATLTGYDRYVYSTNETAGVGNILKIEKGNWHVTGNQMIFYAEDGTTELYKFNLRNKAGAGTEVDVYKREKV